MGSDGGGDAPLGGDLSMDGGDAGLTEDATPEPAEPAADASSETKEEPKTDESAAA